MKFAFHFFSYLIILSCFSCTTKVKPIQLFELQTNTGVNFENDVQDQKLNNSFIFRNFYNGGGVAIGDINNDGLPDIFLTSNMGENKLYLNKGNFHFEDVTKKAGIFQNNQWSTGVVFADVNGDGWLDIYVCNSGHMKDSGRKNQLYINNHNNTFTECAAKYGLDFSGYATQASFFDYDGDGDLDCFIIDNSPIPVNQLGYANRRDLPANQWPIAGFLKGGGDHLYRNDNGHFTEVTKQAGIHGGLISFGLGVSVADINGDGWPDIYVSNDSYERDYLYINQGNGTFKDACEQCFQHNSFSSMGADIGDINNDGYPDIFTTDMLPADDYRLKTLGGFDNIDLYRAKEKAGFYHQFMKNCLQLNDKNGRFIDIGNYAGVSASDWSWGGLMFDADNDGLLDLYVCNGVNRDVTNLDFMDFFANDVIQKMVLTGKKEDINQVLAKIPRTPLPNKAFKNLGNLKFYNAGNDWGFTQPSFSNGAAYADLNNDGALDLVVNNENQQVFIYKNNARILNHNNYISILLKGKDKNTFAVGGKIKVYIGKQILSREVIPSRGFQSSVDYKQVIGLGKATMIDSMVIDWPDRTFSKYIHPKIDTSFTILQPLTNTNKSDTKQQFSANTLLDSVKSNFDKHQEDDYVDFYYERNLPEMLSREGPKAAWGDVNGDGLPDVYIGGTSEHAGQLYLQTTDGKFIKKDEKIFQQFLDFEDEAVLFFDADGDGDLDLVIGPGGNNNPPFSRQTQLRLYKNDGKGNFTLDADAFPSIGVDVGAIAAYDFNHDGKLDLFVGGRNVPRDYGENPSSYLFVNDGNGHFTDIAKTKNPDIANIGMVTGAVWANISGDTAKELIIVGEWMSPRIFSFNRDHFIEQKTNLSNLYGWWRTVAVTDLNNDGKQDLVLGNIGENFYLNPDAKDPVKLWINDFDQNGTVDKILTRTVDGQDKPVFLKHELEEQIPAIKKQSLRHEQYAKKTIQDLFAPDILKNSIVKTFNYPSSCIAINNGNGNFTVEKMPPMLQLSSVNAVLCTDVNNDGNIDIITAGNLFEFPPQLERLDGSFGNVLINDGKGNFQTLNSTQSGLLVEGEVRDIAPLFSKQKKYILFLRNDDYPVLYQIKKPLQNKSSSK